MKKENICGSLIMLAVIILMTLLILVFIEERRVKRDSCIEAGFEGRYRNIPISSCEDSEGNIHFVKMECDNGFLGIKDRKCTTKLIKVGEVYGSRIK